MSMHLKRKFETNNEFSPKQWEHLKSDIYGLPLGNGTLVNRVNRDSVILKEILHSEEISLGKSFYDSFQKNRSVLLDDYMLKLFTNANDEQIEVFQDFVIDLASAVLKKGKASLPPHVYWQAIEALARTRVWRETADKHLQGEEYSEGSDSGGEAASKYILRALKEKDFYLMWKLMHGKHFNQNFNILREMIPDEIVSCHEKVNCDWIKHCEVVRNEEGEEVAELEMEKLFSYLRTVGRYIGSETQAALLEYYKQSRTRHARHGGVNRGTCLACRTELGRREITQEELVMLQEALMEFVIKKKDIYQSTDPRELDKFLRLLAREKKLAPFDIVIDGLNISLNGRHNLLLSNREGFERNPHKSYSNNSLNLYATVKHFFDQDCKVLVIHRAEIRKSPDFDSISKMAKVVILGKVTQDDPYMILAALHSGSGCRMVTNDHLRQHCVSLAKGSPGLAKLFTEWQVAHQVRITHFSYSGAGNKNKASRAEPQFVWPVTHSLVAEQVQPFWHIPIMPKDTHHGFIIPSAWLCVGPGEDKTK